jgi:hypothetical protein
MILRHTNDRVTRKHYIKLPPITAMRRLSKTLSALESSKLLPNCSPQAPFLSSRLGSASKMRM